MKLMYLKVVIRSLCLAHWNKSSIAGDKGHENFRLGRARNEFSI